MLERIIRTAIAQRWLVLLLALPVSVGRRIEAAAAGRGLDAIDGGWRRVD